MVDVGNVQAIVARASAKAHYAVLFFALGDIAGARRFLREWAPQVPSGTAPDPPGRAVMHLLFGWSGLEKLVDGLAGLDAAEGRRRFDPFFVDPAQAPDKPAMAEQLGFVGDSRPEHWWGGFRTGDIELAVYGAFDDEAQRTDSVRRILASADACGLRELRSGTFPGGSIEGYRPPGGRLHFGYRDGITTPAVDWEDRGTPGSVDCREVVLGYPNATYPTSPFPAGPWRDFSREGSFACLSWIEQDVPRFERLLDENAAAVAPLAAGADPREWLAARLLGRWRNGTPLMLHPDGETEPAAFTNDFGYAGDPMGAVCPLTAHIRIAYSRDQPMTFPNKVRFPGGPPRLVRRGFSYGAAWTGDTNDRTARGIVGLFFCARVNEQFYTVLRWMNRTDFSDVFAKAPNGRDALIADRSTPGSAETLRVSDASIKLANVLTYRGVAVLFAPGLAALGILLRR